MRRARAAAASGSVLRKAVRQYLTDKAAFRDKVRDFCRQSRTAGGRGGAGVWQPFHPSVVHSLPAQRVRQDPRALSSRGETAGRLTAVRGCRSQRALSGKRSGDVLDEELGREGWRTDAAGRLAEAIAAPPAGPVLIGCRFAPAMLAVHCPWRCNRNLSGLHRSRTISSRPVAGHSG